MKRIEIKDQLRHRIALELADRQMAEADQKYGTVKGKMKNAFMKRYAVCAFLGALLWFPIILGGVLHA